MTVYFQFMDGETLIGDPHYVELEDTGYSWLWTNTEGFELVWTAPTGWYTDPAVGVFDEDGELLVRSELTAGNFTMGADAFVNWVLSNY